jgi:DNA invertase Pin-like site-specific DNA recombinase
VITKRSTAKRDTTRRVLVYIRISKDRANEISTDVQEHAARRYARDKGWQIVGVYVDRGRSAFKANVRRPEYDRMLADIDAGVGDTILVYRLDRLSRSAADFGVLWKRLRRAGAEFVSVNDAFDTTTAMGTAALQIAMVFAELESGIKSERIRDWHEERAARGAQPTGPRPFGYRVVAKRNGAPRERVIVDDEAALVRDAARRLVKGTGTVAGIVTAWNDAGWRTTRGKRWGRSTLIRLLTNPHTAGLRQLDGELVPGTWRPILSRALYDDVCTMLADPSRRTSNGNGRRYLLTGIVRCGVCGTPMGTRSTVAGSRYTCMSRTGHDACGKVSIEIERTDRVVLAAVKERFGADDVKAALASADPHAVVDALEDELEALARDYGTGGIGPAEWRAARAGLEERLAHARDTAAQPRPVKVNVARLDDEPLDAQRLFVAWAFPEITVRPGRPGHVGFDPGRIAMKPRRRSRTRTRSR